MSMYMFNVHVHFLVACVCGYVYLNKKETHFPDLQLKRRMDLLDKTGSVDESLEYICIYGAAT